MIKVSIIVPVYNVEKYIKKCLDSLVNQTLKDIEIIVVNDGTPDNSIDIVREYLNKDKRIKLYEKENGGQASARNLGLKYACGEYIAFLDSDDYVSADMYETMYNIAKKDELDIVISNYYYDYKEKVEKANSEIGEKVEKNLSSRDYILLSPSPCNKIIKRTFLLNINFKFPEGIIYEDFASIPLLGLYNPKIKYINKCLYYYVQSDSSTMRNLEYKEKYEDIFNAVKYLYDNSINKGFDKEIEYLISYHLLYLGSLNFYKYKKYHNINKISIMMRKYFPNWYKNELLMKNIDKRKIFYMKLFYYKLYFIINFYRRIKNV